MRLAAALTVVVGFVLGYALLPALRPAPKATSATGALWEPASGTPSVSTGAPVVAVEESAGALSDYPQIPGRGGVSTAPPSPTIARPAPTASRIPKARATSRPSARVASAGGHHVAGTATWYCCTKGHSAGSPTAAAGPALRAALGSHWRGRWVRVTGGGSATVVKLDDWCQCGSGRVIDLHPGPFGELAALSAGIVRVTVTW